MKDTNGIVGFACAYTPLSLIHAAGFTPYRILPEGDCPDQAGHLLHDNLCPHVKKILDRALGGTVPKMAGMVFMNSCDAMRRLYDAWISTQGHTEAVLVDLPATVSESTTRFFRNELERLSLVLGKWGRNGLSADGIRRSMDLYNRQSALFAELRQKVMSGTLDGGYAALQKAYNRASVASPEESIEMLRGMSAAGAGAGTAKGSVEIYLFGNVLPDPEAFGLFESCGARIISDDMCTGSRLFAHIDHGSGDDVLLDLAGGLLSGPKCARTFDANDPGALARDVVNGARACGARGVLGYTTKFCDPYIARLPGVRDALRREGIPLLLLEGDCTLRSIGQQRTRIEAFIEMVR